MRLVYNGVLFIMQLPHRTPLFPYHLANCRKLASLPRKLAPFGSMTRSRALLTVVLGDTPGIHVRCISVALGNQALKLQRVIRRAAAKECH